jgi:hypothetical protein
VWCSAIEVFQPRKIVARCSRLKGPDQRLDHQSQRMWSTPHRLHSDRYPAPQLSAQHLSSAPSASARCPAPQLGVQRLSLVSSASAWCPAPQLGAQRLSLAPAP